MPFVTRKMVMFRRQTAGVSFSHSDKRGKNLRELPSSVTSHIDNSSTDGKSVISLHEGQSMHDRRLSTATTEHASGADSSACISKPEQPPASSVLPRDSIRKISSKSGLKIVENNGSVQPPPEPTSNPVMTSYKTHPTSSTTNRSSKSAPMGTSVAKVVSSGSIPKVQSPGGISRTDSRNLKPSMTSSRKSDRKQNARSRNSRVSKDSLKKLTSSSKIKISIPKNPSFIKQTLKNTDMPYDERQILFSIELIKSNLKKLHDTPPISPKGQTEAIKYENFEKKTPKFIKPITCDSCHEATHKEFPEVKLICKVYKREEMTESPAKMAFLRILRFLGKKHPSLDGAWDVFETEQFIHCYTEYAGFSNVKLYIQEKGPFRECRTQELTWQIFKAMDYLGDTGLSHRRIEPKHILIYRIQNEFIYKLTGFTETVEYWDTAKEEVILQDCIPIQREAEGNFQAPEMFGDPAKEVYDPISADIWSFGASIFFSLCKNYPYNYEKPTEKIGDEIQENVRKIYITNNCTDFLSKILHIDAGKRMTFSQINQHPWLIKI